MRLKRSVHVPLSSILLSLLLVGEISSVALPEDITAPKCVACAADAERMRSSFSEDDWKALAAGETVTSEIDASEPATSAARSFQSAVIIPAPPDRVWKVLVDFESRPNYMPNMKEVRIVRVDANRVWLAERLKVMFTTIRYQIIAKLDPQRGVMHWDLDPSAPHDIASTTGSYQLTPLAQGRTLLTYRASVDTGKPVPHFIENLLLKRSLPHVVEGFRSEVARRLRQ